MYAAELKYFSITSTHILSIKGKISFNVRFESSASCMILMASCIHADQLVNAYRQKMLSSEGLTMQRVHFSSWLKTVSTSSYFSKGSVAAGRSIQPIKTVTPLHHSIFMLAQHKIKGGVVVQFYTAILIKCTCESISAKQSYFIQA